MGVRTNRCNHSLRGGLLQTSEKTDRGCMRRRACIAAQQTGRWRGVADVVLLLFLALVLEQRVFVHRDSPAHHVLEDREERQCLSHKDSGNTRQRQGPTPAVRPQSRIAPSSTAGIAHRSVGISLRDTHHRAFVVRTVLLQGGRANRMTLRSSRFFSPFPHCFFKFIFEFRCSRFFSPFPHCFFKFIFEFRIKNFAQVHVWERCRVGAGSQERGARREGAG